MPPKILAPLPIQFWRRSVDRNTAGERMPNLRYYVAQVSPATAGLYRGFPNPPTLCAREENLRVHKPLGRNAVGLSLRFDERVGETRSHLRYYVAQAS